MLWIVLQCSQFGSECSVSGVGLDQANDHGAPDQGIVHTFSHNLRFSNNIANFVDLFYVLELYPSILYWTLMFLLLHYHYFMEKWSCQNIRTFMGALFFCVWLEPNPLLIFILVFWFRPHLDSALFPPPPSDKLNWSNSMLRHLTYISSFTVLVLLVLWFSPYEGVVCVLLVLSNEFVLYWSEIVLGLLIDLFVLSPSLFCFTFHWVQIVFKDCILSSCLTNNITYHLKFLLLVVIPALRNLWNVCNCLSALCYALDMVTLKSLLQLMGQCIIAWLLHFNNVRWDLWDLLFNAVSFYFFNF